MSDVNKTTHSVDIDSEDVNTSDVQDNEASLKLRAQISAITDAFVQPGEKYLDDINDSLYELFVAQNQALKEKLLERKINGFFTQKVGVGVKHVTSGAVTVEDVNSVFDQAGKEQL